MTEKTLIHAKALAAAGSVVLALGLTACDLTSDYGVDASADTGDTAACETDGAWLTCDDADQDALFDCCEKLAKVCLALHPVDEDARTECTYGPDYDGSTGCIPWGPPVPPALA